MAVRGATVDGHGPVVTIYEMPGRHLWKLVGNCPAAVVLIVLLVMHHK